MEEVSVVDERASKDEVLQAVCFFPNKLNITQILAIQML